MLLVLIGFVLLGVLVGKFVNPPFFADENISVGGGTRVYKFFPVYLWSYEKDSRLAVKVFYLKHNKLPAIGDVWISGKYKGFSLEPVYYYDKSTDEILRLGSLGEVRGNFKFGERLGVEYITGYNLYGRELGKDSAACLSSPRICQVYDYVKSSENAFVEFSGTGKLPKGVLLPALQLISRI